MENVNFAFEHTSVFVFNYQETQNNNWRSSLATVQDLTPYIPTY